MIVGMRFNTYYPLRLVKVAALTLLAALLLGASAIPPGDKIERVRANTRGIEFDYVSWGIDALKPQAQAACLWQQ